MLTVIIIFSKFILLRKQSNLNFFLKPKWLNGEMVCLSHDKSYSVINKIQFIFKLNSSPKDFCFLPSVILFILASKGAKTSPSIHAHSPESFSMIN